MKLTLVLALSFLLPLLTNLPLASLAFTHDQVRDSNGDAVFPGFLYYFVPSNRKPPWLGLRLGQTGNSNCNLTIMQDYKRFHGISMSFFLRGITLGIIFTGTPIEIKVDKPSCAVNAKLLVFKDETINKECIGIRGSEVLPEEKSFTGRFHFEQSSHAYDGYKLLFCKHNSRTNCSYVGRFDSKQENGTRLILTENAEEGIDIVLYPIVNWIQSNRMLL